MQEIKYLLGLILCGWSFSPVASTINEIRYEGNETTQISLLNREIYIKTGDPVDYKLIEKSRQAVMDLDLFKTVTFYLQGSSKHEQAEKTSLVDVVFVVKEKYYAIVLPRLKVDDDEFHLGIQLRWDNVAGLNHEMRVLFESRGDTRGIHEERNHFRYFYPNVNNGAFNAGVNIQESNEVDISDGVINRQDDVFSVGLSRWLNSKGRNHGWFMGGSVLFQQRENEVLEGNALSDDIDAVVLGAEVGYVNVSNHEYNRGGKAYGYKLDWSHESIGSDDFFIKHYLYYRSYYRFHNFPLSNLNVQTLLGYSNNDVLGEPAFKLGSRDDLRGYENDRFNGNSMLLTNVEYMFPHNEYPIIRYVGFIDVGNTYEEFSDVLHSPLNVGVGIGLRWKIKAFVKLDLRADFGYGVTDSDYKFSFGTRNAF